MATDPQSDNGAPENVDGRTRPWNELSHPEQMQLLRDRNEAEILAQYRPVELTPEQFDEVIRTARRLWRPDALGAMDLVKELPDKRQLLGAPRDIDRTEALLELIDNSIDVWRKRKARYPDRTTTDLAIYIDYDERDHILTYEDNAGGVARDIAHYLAIPGHSETQDQDRSVGSYRTGGKKAIFKLARAANIETRYLSPTYGPEQRYSIHLDERWLNSSDIYDFPIYDLPNAPDMELGQTIYKFYVRDRTWDSALFKQILDAIRRVYSLLLVRNPNIHIYFMDRQQPVAPLDDLYAFTWAYKPDAYDLRPQRAHFKTSLPYGNELHDVEIEIVLGCRTSVGSAKGNDNWGIDFYGNDRQFKAYDQSEVFAWYGLPTGQGRQAIRGIIDIHGPNVVVPWDTHKRYINNDTPTVDFLRHTPAVRQFFDAWKLAYNNLSRAYASVDRGTTQPWIKGSDIRVAFSETITIAEGERKRRSVRSLTHKPSMVLSQRTAEGPTLSLTFTEEEYRQIIEKLGIRADTGDRNARRQVSDELKKVILDKWLRGRRLG